MSGILQEIIVGLITFLTTGGLGSILYFRLQKKLKESEVKAAELENKNKEINMSSSINDEWEKMYNKSKEEIDRKDEMIKVLNTKMEELYLSKEKSWEMCSASKIDCARKDRLISELNWYRCEINGCPYRKPPRKYGDFDFPENGVVETDDSKKSEN